MELEVATPMVDKVTHQEVIQESEAVMVAVGYLQDLMITSEVEAAIEEEEAHLNRHPDQEVDLGELQKIKITDLGRTNTTQVAVVVMEVDTEMETTPEVDEESQEAEVLMQNEQIKEI